MTTVKELRKEAKALGIKGYGSMTKDVLVDAIFDAELAASFARGYPVIDNSDSDFFPEDTTMTATPKMVEFVYGDNLMVQFKWEGVLNTLGWSKKDFKFHHFNHETRVSRLTSYNSEIRNFKNLKNGDHGDIARVVKALARLKAKPAAIVVAERKSKLSNNEAGVPASVQQDVSRRRGTVDVDVMNVFVGMYAEAFSMDESDVRKDGRLIKAFIDAWNSSDSEGAEAHEYAAWYISDIYNTMADEAIASIQ